MAKIEHVVVVMLENRSFDNVLGWMQSGFPGTYSNPNPNDPSGPAIALQNLASQTIGGAGASYPGTMIPLLDPGELLGDMAQQFLGLESVPAKDPWTSTADANMQGFTNNYAAQIGSANEENNSGDVMNYLTAEQLPVTAFLAQNYAICEQWYASVPSQTFVNRLFAFCAAPSIIYGSPNYSAVNDLDHPAHVLSTLTPMATVLDLPSICSQLDATLTNEVNWKVYFHDYSIAALTIPYIASAARYNANVNVATFDTSDWGDALPTQLGAQPTTFLDDVTNANGGALSPFSFIEPRYSVGLAPNPLPPNSNHPGPDAYGLKSIISDTDPSNPPIDATGGELLLMQVYNLLIGSSYWDTTLLIITYDEPGGTYDHVPPSPMTPPGEVNLSPGPALLSPKLPVPAAQAPTSGDTAANGFGYGVSGGRVPAIIVSPLIEKGSVIAPPGTTVFDHSSIVATVWDLMNLSPSSGRTSLTARDLAAPTLTSALNSTNSTKAFSGTLVACPSALFFNSKHVDPAAQTILASAGPGGDLKITATPLVGPSTKSTPTFKISTSVGTADVTAYSVEIKDCFLASDGTYTATITIDAGAAGTSSIAVTLYVS